MPEYGETSVLSDKAVDMQTCCLFTKIKNFLILVNSTCALIRDLYHTNKNLCFSQHGDTV